MPPHLRPWTARRFVFAYVAAAIAFLSLDAVWLTTMYPRLYVPAIGHVLRPDFDALAAASFYAVYLAGLVFFAVRPSPDGRSALLRGAFLGLVCYATYDLTNQATVAGWRWLVTFADLAWGAFATGTTAWAVHHATRAARF